MYKKGELLQGRYELLLTLGEGAFGRVIKCLDHERHGRKVALKVIKNVQKYREEAKLEIKVLETIMEKDRKGRSGCIYLLDWFNFHGFMCLAFDMLGKSIYDFLKDNQYYPYPRRHIKKIAYQLGMCLVIFAFLTLKRFWCWEIDCKCMLIFDMAFEKLISNGLSNVCGAFVFALVWTGIIKRGGFDAGRPVLIASSLSINFYFQPRFSLFNLVQPLVSSILTSPKATFRKHVSILTLSSSSPK